MTIVTDTSSAKRHAFCRLVTAGGVALILLAAACHAAACGSHPDPFLGVWWEPSSGRRIEIDKSKDGYVFLYGSGKRPYTATLRSGALHIAQPIGGDILVQRRAAGGLQLVIDGTVSRLIRIPQHE